MIVSGACVRMLASLVALFVYVLSPVTMRRPRIQATAHIGWKWPRSPCLDCAAGAPLIHASQVATASPRAYVLPAGCACDGGPARSAHVSS